MNDGPRPEIAIVADLPADLRHVLAQGFILVDEPLEGVRVLAIHAISARHRALATRAVLDVAPGLIEALPDLRLVLSLKAGLDHIDVDAPAARGIELAHTPDQFTEDVADFALGLIYAARRRSWRRTGSRAAAHRPGHGFQTRIGSAPVASASSTWSHRPATCREMHGAGD